MEASRYQCTRIKMTQGEIEHLVLFMQKMLNKEFTSLNSDSPCLGLYEDEKYDIEQVYVALCNAKPEQSFRESHNFSKVNDDEVITIKPTLRNRLQNMRKNIGPDGRRYGWVGSEKRFPLANKCFKIWLAFLDALAEEKGRGLQ